MTKKDKRFDITLLECKFLSNKNEELNKIESLLKEEIHETSENVIKHIREDDENYKIKIEHLYNIKRNFVSDRERYISSLKGYISNMNHICSDDYGCSREREILVQSDTSTKNFFLKENLK